MALWFPKFGGGGPEVGPYTGGHDRKPSNACCYERKFCVRVEASGFTAPRPIHFGDVDTFCCGCDSFTFSGVMPVIYIQRCLKIVGQFLAAGSVPPANPMFYADKYYADEIADQYDRADGMNGECRITYDPKSYLLDVYYTVFGVGRFNIAWSGTKAVHHWQKHYEHGDLDPRTFDSEEIPFKDTKLFSGVGELDPSESPFYPCEAADSTLTLSAVHPEGDCGTHGYIDLQINYEPPGKGPYLVGEASEVSRCGWSKQICVDPCSKVATITGTLKAVCWTQAGGTGVETPSDTVVLPAAGDPCDGTTLNYEQNILDNAFGTWIFPGTTNEQQKTRTDVGVHHYTLVDCWYPEWRVASQNGDIAITVLFYFELLPGEMVRVNVEVFVAALWRAFTQVFTYRKEVAWADACGVSLSDADFVPHAGTAPPRGTDLRPSDGYLFQFCDFTGFSFTLS